MEIYFLRHGIAVKRGTEGYKNDSERPLTEKGVRRMRETANGMHDLGLDFDWILSSPYVRAKQTAEIVATVFDQKVNFSKSLTDRKSTRLNSSH